VLVTAITAVGFLQLIVTKNPYCALNVPQESEPMESSTPPLSSKTTTNLPRPSSDCNFHFKDRRKGVKEPCEGCTSQGAQDVILGRIFGAIGTENKQCVEFGFGYGSEKAKAMTLADFGVGKNDTSGTDKGKLLSGLNTQALLVDGWKGLFIDAEVSNPNINLAKHVLTMENIAQVFQEENVPINVDYVSIDVDSIDVWLLYGLLADGYRPRVISVEYNANFPPHMLLACERTWAPWVWWSRVYGSSAASINMVAEMFGYQVVEIMVSLDMFFVRKDLLKSQCRNSEQLPNFRTLAENRAGEDTHRFCNSAQVSRLVDFPLSLIGLEEEAKAKAIDSVEELNQWREERGMKAYCNLATVH